MKQTSGFRVLYAVLLRPLQGTCISATQIHHRRISQQPRWTWTQESGNNSWASYVFANRSSLETFWSTLNGKLLVCWLDLLRLFRALICIWHPPWRCMVYATSKTPSTWTSGWVHEETKPDHCKKPMSTTRVWKHWAQRSRDIKSIQLALASNPSGSPKFTDWRRDS